MPITLTKNFRLSSGFGVNNSKCPKWAKSMIGSHAFPRKESFYLDSSKSPCHTNANLRGWRGSMRNFSTILLCTLTCAGLWAQSTSVAQISGTVQDSTGSAVPGAQVRATQTDTGLARAAVSNADGSYVLTNLPVGPYRLEASKDGFSTYVQTGIVLQVNTNPTVNISLKVGSINEQVQVEAAATMVETRTTGVGQVVDSQRIVDIPLNGRVATDLIYLAGAAAPAPNADLVSTKNYPNEAVLSIGGGMANGTLYMLDGATHNDPFNNLNLPLPFPD